MIATFWPSGRSAAGFCEVLYGYINRYRAVEYYEVCRFREFERFVTGRLDVVVRFGCFWVLYVGHFPFFNSRGGIALDFSSSLLSMCIIHLLRLLENERL